MSPFVGLARRSVGLRRRSLFLLTLFLVVALGFTIAFKARAATAILIPDADADVGWTPSSGTSRYTLVDEGVTPITTDYISSGTTTASVIQTFSLSNQAGIAGASQIVLKVHAKSNTNANGGALDTLSVNITVGGTPMTAITCTPVFNVWSDCVATFDGAWTQAEVDSMQVSLTKNTLGSGNPAGQRDDIFVANVYGTLTYVPGQQYSQSSYRFYENTDSTDVGAPLASQNSPVKLNGGQAFRLRMNVGVDNAPAAAAVTGWTNKLSAGMSHVCAVASDNQAYCWGQNGSGQLGNGNVGSDSSVPSPVFTSGVLAGKTIQNISAGGYHTCAVTSDGLAYCWGSNTYGQLGNGNTTRSNVPVAVSMSGALAGKTILRISAGNFHTCAIASDNKAYCWGVNSYGQLGNGNTGTASSVPVAVSTSGILAGKSIQSVSAGSYRNCAVTSDGVASCWGYNSYGQLGNGNTGTNSNVPVAVSNTGALAGKTVLRMAVGDYVVCAIASDNQAYCWGRNTYGGLGNGNFGTDSNVPVAVSTSGALTGKTILSISVGIYHTCAIASDNQSYCWGNNNYGQLGFGSGNSNVPVAVSTSGLLSGQNAQYISAGEDFTCITASDNQPYCWGINTYGQLGKGTAGPKSNMPVRVASSSGFHLQYKLSDAASCDASGSYSDVTNETPIRFADNPTAINGSSLTANTNDPSTGSTRIYQSYTEAYGDVNVINAVPSGQEGVWDFSLQYATGAALSPHPYCLRLVQVLDSQPFTSYGVLPTIQTANDMEFSQSDFRFYQEADSLTPGAPLAATNSGATLGSAHAAFRLRSSIALGDLRFSKVSSGFSHTCAISTDGRAYCWGYNTAGQLGISNTSNSNIPLAISRGGVLADKTIKDISAGDYHTCAVASDRNAYCWGNNPDGQLGDGTYTKSNTPVAVSTNGALAGKTILSISSGDGYSCAIASDNQAYCWGLNTLGQLGDGTNTKSNTPVAVTTSGVLAGKTILSISVANSSTCAIASDHQAYCWGRNAFGQLGNGNTGTDSNVPVAVSTSGVLAGKTIQNISVGRSHTCAIASDDRSYCWGFNSNGQLGNGNNTASNVPVAVSTSGILAGKTIKSISAGDYHTCAIASDDHSYCWGYNSNGQVGNGNTGTDSNVPVAVSLNGALAGKTISYISVGDSYTCAIASDTQSYCWGRNSTGQLGNANTGTDSNAPEAVSTNGVLAGKTIQNISVGRSHTCAIASDTQSYCWGRNDSGQLGNGSTNNDSNIPVAVSTSGALAGKTIQKLSAGGSHACAIASDNQAYCWGNKSYGQLGNGSTGASSNIPVAVSTSGALAGKSIQSISAGGYYTCAIASDNQAYCWGQNNTSQLGNGNTGTDSNVPVAVSTSGVLAGKTIQSISSGLFHTCAIASDNQVYCWGSNSSGQLGNGNTGTDSNVPVAVSTSGVLAGKTVLSIAVGNSYTCVIASDNKAYCWGNNLYGNLGNGNTGTGSNVPVAVSTSGVLAGKTVQRLSVGSSHACAIASDNQTYCWGQNNNGQLGNGNTGTDSNVPVTVSTNGVLYSKSIQDIAAGDYSACVIASDNQAYCWGINDTGELGNGSTGSLSNIPEAVFKKSKYSMAYSNVLKIKLQYAAKGQVSCRQQTGYADITNSTDIAYKDNPSVVNQAAISNNGNDPISNWLSISQTHHDTYGVVANPNPFSNDEKALWDFSLKDNNASPGATYCIRMVGENSSFGIYTYYPEITMAPGGGVGPTLDQMLRGGQSVVDGVKNPFSW